MFGDLEYAKPQNLYAGSPLTETKALNAVASEQYDTNKENRNKLDVALSNLSLEDRNNPIKARVLNDLKTKLKGVTESGNYQDAQYAVQDAKKSFETDQELQSALKSKQHYDSYLTDLQGRLKKGLAGEKGGITERQYNYALTKSKLANKDQVKYDPNTMTATGIFKGHQVSDDLSSEIQDDLLNMTKDWKANGQITVDGKTYTKGQVNNLTGVEKVYRNGKEVPYNEVADAMKKYVMNKEPYRKYLSESRDIDKFNKTFDMSTGKERPLDRQDLSSYSDKELLNLYRGADDEKIAQLAKSKSTADKSALAEIQTREKQFDLNDPKLISQLHDGLAARDQLNNVVHPAAEKASFHDFEDKLFTDHAALEEIKGRKAKELELYKHKLTNLNLPPVVEGESQVNLFTGQDYAQKKANIQTLQSGLGQAKDLLSKTDPNSSLYRTRMDDYNKALGMYNTANAELGHFYSNVPEEYKKKIGDKIDQMFTFADKNYGNVHNSDNIFGDNSKESFNRKNAISVENIDKLVQEAKVNKDVQFERDLYAAKIALQDGRNTDEILRNRLSKEISNNENYLRIASEAYNHIKANRTITDNPISHFNSIDDIIKGAYNDKALVEDQGLRLRTIPDLGVKENSPLANQFHSVSKAIISNAMDLTTNDGTPLDKIIGGNAEKKFWSRNAKGSYVEDDIDPSKTKVAIASGAKDGVKRISATFYNHEGEPLVMSDGTPSEKNGARNAVILSSNDPNTFTPLYNIVANYSSQNGDNETAKSVNGELHFADMLNRVRLGTSVDPFEVNIPALDQTKGGDNSRIIAFHSDGKDASTIIDMTPNISGHPNPNYGKPLFGPNHSTFRSNEQMLKAFEMARH